MLRARRAGIESFLALGILAAGMTGTTSCSRRSTDARTLLEVQERLRSDGRLAMSRFQVIDADGVITLSGFVNTTEQRKAAVQDARQVRGVETVVDNLKLSGPNRLVITVSEPMGDTPEQDPVPQQNLKPSKIVRATLRQNVTSTTRADTEPATAASSVPVSNAREPTTTKQPSDSSHRTGSNTFSRGPVSVATAPARAPAEVNVPYGTLLPVRLTESLSSDFNVKGDFFMATLASPILVGNEVVIPEGASVRGRVVEANNAGRFSGKPQLVVEAIGLGYNGNIYELSTNQYSRQGPSRGRRGALLAGGGAGLGTILGAIFGGGKGAAIGAIAGAGAGSGVQAASKGGTVQLPAESIISFRLQAPLTVTPSTDLKGPQEWSGASSSDSSSGFERPMLKQR
jgi:BON domain